MRVRASLLSLFGLLLGAAVVAGAHVSMNGNLRMLLHPEAFTIVFGGTAAAILVSYPGAALRGALAGVIDLWRLDPAPVDTLLPTFLNYARKARRQGLPAVEREIAGIGDPFLARALSLSVSGLSPAVVRDALEVEDRVIAERDEQRAQVFEAAGGYAPTLGIVGAVLGLMRVMQHFASPAEMGAGIAAAFVATVFGLAAANLVFLPLATRLRARARVDALRRELVIEGVLALRDGASPGVLEERLAGYLSLGRSPSAVAEVA
jgi:chemotaxis protein MotA